MNLLQDILGREKVSYWKLRQEISLANTGAFGFILLVSVRVYGYLEAHGMVCSSLLLSGISCVIWNFRSHNCTFHLILKIDPLCRGRNMNFECYFAFLQIFTFDHSHGKEQILCQLFSPPWIIWKIKVHCIPILMSTLGLLNNAGMLLRRMLKTM